MDDTRLDRMGARIETLESLVKALSLRVGTVEAITRKGPQFQTLLGDTLKGSLGLSVDKASGDTIRIRLL